MKLSDLQIDGLTEMVNIGVGRAAASLSELIGERIELHVPSIEVCQLDELVAQMESGDRELETSIVQDFRGNVSGRAVLSFPRESGLKLGQVLGNLDTMPDEVDLDLQGILVEVGNILLNAVLGTVGNVLDSTLAYTVPELCTGSRAGTLLTERVVGDSRDHAILIADARFRVSARDISGSLVVLFEVGSIDTLSRALLAELETSSEAGV